MAPCQAARFVAERAQRAPGHYFGSGRFPPYKEHAARLGRRLSRIYRGIVPHREVVGSKLLYWGCRPGRAVLSIDPLIAVLSQACFVACPLKSSLIALVKGSD